MIAGRRLSSVSVAIACALLLLASPAGARKFRMSGIWIVRSGAGFIPLQFATVVGGYEHVSMGNLTAALGYPNGPIPGEGGVTATGSGPATLQIPLHRFVEDPMVLLPLNGITLVQVTTNRGIDAPVAPATLAPGLGPGSFTWCPDDPVCVAGGGMRSTDPPWGAGRRNGRVIYRAGANQFGGAMQLGLRRGGTRSFLFNNSPRQVGHVHCCAPTTGTFVRAPGGLGSPDVPRVERLFLPLGFVTQPTMAPPPFSPILYPGPKLTTMFGTTHAGSGAVFYLPQIATGPMGTKAGTFTTQYGFANTTGTVIAQQTVGTNGQDFFTVMGSDARTALGAGNLSLVAGGLTFQNTLAGEDVSATFHKLNLTFAPPIPSLSPAGLAAAAALVLLAAGWALRRRLG